MYECENDFRKIIDRVYIRFGRLIVKDFDNLLKFGNPELRTTRNPGTMLSIMDMTLPTNHQYEEPSFDDIYSV